jgi:hypothetical protein
MDYSFGLSDAEVSQVNNKLENYCAKRNDREAWSDQGDKDGVQAKGIV